MHFSFSQIDVPARHGVVMSGIACKKDDGLGFEPDPESAIRESCPEFVHLDCVAFKFSGLASRRASCLTRPGFDQLNLENYLENRHDVCVVSLYFRV